MTTEEIVKKAYLEGHMHGAAEYVDHLMLERMLLGDLDYFYDKALKDYNEQSETKQLLNQTKE